jgi:hypothetical protein
MIRLVSQSVKSFKEKLLEKCNLFGAKNCPAFYLKVFYIDSAIDISISIILEYDSNSKLIGFHIGYAIEPFYDISVDSYMKYRCENMLLKYVLTYLTHALVSFLPHFSPCLIL